MQNKKIVIQFCFNYAVFNQTIAVLSISYFYSNIQLSTVHKHV